MRSLVGSLLNKAPVSYVPRRSSLLLPTMQQADPVAHMTAMGSVGTLFAIVHRLSNAAAQIDWHLWRKAQSGRKEDRTEVTAHAVLDLWNRPNPFMPNQEFVETFQQHIDLTGEGWWIIARDPRSKIPLELWPARPDRMAPVPHPTDFIAGYTYTSPDGELVPLGRDDVIQLRMPNPLDPYRGMGPVQAVLADLDATKYSALWNRNFFLNSAEPGGIIELDRNLTDEQFDQLRMRWSEQHRGVANAHRVAILEHGKWVERKFSQREMQFIELRTVSRDVIREAFGIPKFAVGDINDINRATADASAAWFAAQMMVPRLERIRWALNFELLPLFGPTAEGLEFDYDNPVGADRQIDSQELTAQASAASALTTAGYDPAGVLEAVGLPKIAFVGAAPALPVGPAPGLAAPSRRTAGVLDVAEAGHNHRPGAEDPLGCVGCRPDWLNAKTTLEAVATESAVATRGDWGDRVAALVETWTTDVSPAQFAELVDQVRTIVTDGSPADLAELTVSIDAAAEALVATMFAQATAAAERVVAAAAKHGVTIVAAVPADPTSNRAPATLTNAAPTYRVIAGLAADLWAAAKVTASNLASSLTSAASREALRAWAPSATADDVAGRVGDYLDGLTTSTLSTALAAPVWAAENEGRFATMDEAEADGKGATTYTSSEALDSASCGPCEDIDGNEYASLDDAKADYPFGGYKDCDGMDRCRGTVEASWGDS